MPQRGSHKVSIPCIPPYHILSDLTCMHTQPTCYAWTYRAVHPPFRPSSKFRPPSNVTLGRQYWQTIPIKHSFGTSVMVLSAALGLVSSWGSPLRSATANMDSARQHPDIISEYLQEVSLVRMLVQLRRAATVTPEQVRTHSRRPQLGEMEIDHRLIVSARWQRK